MKLVDTHTHLYLDEFQPTPEDAVKRAIEVGVETMIFPNVDISTIEPMKSLQNKFPKYIFMSMGLHPTEVNENWRYDLEQIKTELDSSDKYIAIGEVGIDLYWDKTFRNEQCEVLAIQMQWACERNLPVIIHCREGLDEILSVMDSLSQVPQCVFHSFGGTIEDIDKIRKRGDFYFGINGIVTFKNSKLRDVLPAIGLDRMLLETDAPYLAPVPHRGKRNESAFIIHTAAHIADVMAVSIENVARATTINAHEFFNMEC